MTRRKVSWSELQSELLTLISDRLGTQSDMCHFRSVCKQWLNATAFSTRRPQNLLSPILPYEFSIDECSFPTQLNDIAPILLVPSLIFTVQSIVSPNTSPWLCTVEELNCGKLYLRQPLSQVPITELHTNVPKKFNLSYFKVQELARFYTIRSSGRLDSSDYMLNWNNLFGKKVNESKVVLIADPNRKTFQSIDDYNAIVLTDEGTLKRIRIKNRRLVNITRPNIKIYDDVISFKGSIYVIDRKGRLYRMDYKSSNLRIVVDQPLGEGSGIMDRKKRLVVSDTHELFLIHRSPSYMHALFKLYKLNSAGKKWVEVSGIGADRILFVTTDGCFFVATKDFPGLRGNCVVFRRDQFPGYSSTSKHDLDIFSGRYDCPIEIDIGLFYFEDGKCKPLKSYHGYSRFFWPPPDWLLSDTELLSSGLSIAEMEIVRGFCNRVRSGQSFETEMSVADSMIAMKDLNKHGEGADDVRGPIIIDIDSFPEIEPKDIESAIAQEKFQGVELCSNLVPILVKIWEKYGNVIQNHVVHSDSHLKWALVSLAKMVIILQTNSNKSLSNSQRSFLSATLKDLLYLHLSLDWLAPLWKRFWRKRNSNHIAL